MNMDPRSAYRQSAGQNASSVRLVVLLYEQLLEDTRRAVQAIEQQDSGKCALEIGHALEVLGQLQGSLDLERGGEVARNLEQFYDLFRASLLRAQIQFTPDILRRQLQNLLTLREAWVEVERLESTSVLASPPSPAPVSPGSSEKNLNWSA